jgi:hypothetical protein
MYCFKVVAFGMWTSFPAGRLIFFYFHTILVPSQAVISPILSLIRISILCQVNALLLSIYRIITLKHIRIEIIHGSQNVFWVLTWRMRLRIGENARVSRAFSPIRAKSMHCYCLYTAIISDINGYYIHGSQNVFWVLTWGGGY